MDINTYYGRVMAEAARAEKLHGPAVSLHEAYAILLEELDEVWDEIKNKNPNLHNLQEELIQVAAMCWKTQELINKKLKEELKAHYSK